MRLYRLKEERIDRYAGPYERWVYSEELGRPYAFPAIRRPEAGHVAAILEGAGDPHAMVGADVRVPPLWPSQGAGHAVTPFAFRDTARDADAPDKILARRLGTLGDGAMAPRVRLNMPVAAASWPSFYDRNAPASGWRRPATPPRAILGVIDDGLPFAHRAFLGGDGRTRISNLWLQSARARDADRVPLGRELTNGDIDAFRAAYGPDERWLYRAAGAIDPDLPEIGRLLDHRATHGAHILGLAGGRDAYLPGPGPGDDVQIVAVQLPNTVAWDTSGFGKEMFMLSALHYIFARASEIARAFEMGAELPLVVNFSYGWNAGRHDGQSEMELAIEELLTRRRALQPESAVVMPTGNTFDRDMHARFTGRDIGDGPARITWRLHPDDRTSSYLEIWLPEGFDPAGWQVRVTPPHGARLDAGDSIEIAPDPGLDAVGDPRRFVEMEIAGGNVGQLSADLHRGNRWRVLVAMIPTAETGTGRRLPAGPWRIEIDPGAGARLGPDQALELWVQRDDDPAVMGMGGRQSRLEGDAVTGYGSLSAICSSDSATRVAGVVGATARAAAYSSAGGVTRGDGGDIGWGVPPTLSALSEQGPMRPGLPSIGSVSGASARLVGTSAAAALASRWMVTNAAEGRTLMAGLAELPAPPDGLDPLRQAARLGTGIVPVAPGADGRFPVA